MFSICITDTPIPSPILSNKNLNITIWIKTIENRRTPILLSKYFTIAHFAHLICIFALQCNFERPPFFLQCAFWISTFHFLSSQYQTENLLAFGVFRFERELHFSLITHVNRISWFNTAIPKLVIKSNGIICSYENAKNIPSSFLRLYSNAFIFCTFVKLVVWTVTYTHTQCIRKHSPKKIRRKIYFYIFASVVFQ